MDDFKVSWRTIFISMFITILFLSLFIGLIVAEKNTKQIGFEDYSHFIVFLNNSTQKQINFNFLGKSFKIDFSSYYNIMDCISNNVYNFVTQHKYFGSVQTRSNVIK